MKASLSALREKGTLMVVGLMGGLQSEINLGRMLKKRLTIKGTVLRPRTPDEKAAIAKTLRNWLPSRLIGERPAIRPVLDSVYALEQIADAHRHMESNTHLGKIVLDHSR